MFYIKIESNFNSFWWFINFFFFLVALSRPESRTRHVQFVKDGLGHYVYRTSEEILRRDQIKSCNMILKKRNNCYERIDMR